MPKLDVVEITTSFAILMDSPEMFESHRFAFFLDGLDEFKPQGFRQNHNTLVRQILQWCSSQSGRLKICISSREEPAFEDGFSEDLRLRLQDLTRLDIRRTASLAVEPLHIRCPRIYRLAIFACAQTTCWRLWLPGEVLGDN